MAFLAHHYGLLLTMFLCCSGGSVTLTSSASSPEQRGIFLTQTIMSLRNLSLPDESNTVQFQKCCYKPSDLRDAVYVSPDAAWLGPQQSFQGDRRSSFSFSNFQEPLSFCDFLSEPLVSDEWHAMASS